MYVNNGLCHDTALKEYWAHLTTLANDFVPTSTLTQTDRLWGGAGSESIERFQHAPCLAIARLECKQEFRGLPSAGQAP